MRLSDTIESFIKELLGASEEDGVELKRNVKNAWWEDMVSTHNEQKLDEGAPSKYEMTGLDCTIIMHPQVWKCSGHYDLFHDFMENCSTICCLS